MSNFFRKNGKRAIVRMAKEQNRLAEQYEKAYIASMTMLRHVDRTNPLFSGLDEDFLRALDKGAAKIDLEKVGKCAAEKS